MNRAVLTLTSAIEERLEAERASVNGGSQTTSLSRSQPMLHNLIGTLCVDVDFLGTNCNKKLCLILHPNAEQKCVLFIQETVQKLQKQKHKKPQEILK